MYVDWIRLTNSLSQKPSTHFARASKSARKVHSKARSNMRQALKSIAEHIQQEQPTYFSSSPHASFVRPGNILQAAITRYRASVFVPLDALKRAASATKDERPHLSDFVDAVLSKAERITVFDPKRIFPINFTGRGNNAGHPQRAIKDQLHERWKREEERCYISKGFSGVAARAAAEYVYGRGKSRTAARNLARSVDRLARR